MELHHNDTFPPLFSVILRGWTWLAGDGRIALRVPSAAFGVLTVPAIFALGSELLSRRTAAIAASLAAISQVLIFYSGVVRAYSLLVCIGAVSTVWFVRVLKSGSRGWRTYAICQILGLYTHYLFIMICIGQAFAFLLVVPRNSVTKRLLVSLASAQMLAAIAFSPWIPVLCNQYARKKAFNLYQNTALTRPDSINYRPPSDGHDEVGRRLASMARETPVVIGKLLGMYPAKRPVPRVLLAIPFLVVVILLMRGVWLGNLPRFGVLSMVVLGVTPFAFVGIWTRGAIPDRYVLPAVPFLILSMASSAYPAERWSSAVPSTG